MNMHFWNLHKYGLDPIQTDIVTPIFIFDNKDKYYS